MRNTIFDKTSWEKVTFGDVAELVKHTEKEPLKNGISRYVGLDHIESEDLHIRRWGDVADGTTFTHKFKRGQILFGRRRAYQKKAAIADFDGICSSDILVFAPNTKVIDRQLFPFIVQNDYFFDYAIKTSAGSLSPRTKFKDLANLEFLLPSLNQQKQFADLLWAVDELIEKYMKLKDRYEIMLDAYMTSKIKKSNHSEITIKKLLVEDPKYGASKKAVNFVNGKPRYIRITDFDDNGNLREETKMTIEGEDYERYRLSHNDVLLARTADPGKSFIYKDFMEEAVYAGYLIKFVFNQKLIIPDYFFIYSNTSHYWEQIRKRQKKGTLSNINSLQFQSIKVRVPKAKEQELIVVEFYEKKKVSNNLLNHIDRSINIKKLLINQIFE